MIYCPVAVMGKNKKRRPCGCAATSFYRVEYGDLSAHRKGESKFFDIFGFCSVHETEFKNPEAYGVPDQWGRSSQVYGLRGRVTGLTVLENAYGIEDVVKRDARKREMAGFKSAIKRMMNQRNAQKASLDDWREAFAELIDEYVVEGVMES